MSKNIYDSANRHPSYIEEFLSLYKYRDLIVQLIKRDLISRYKRSLLGVAWTMINPLGTMIILSVVFSSIFDVKGVYPAYVLSGLIIWNFFSQTTSTAINNMLWGSALFQKIYMPRTIFVISTIGTGLINLFFSLFPFFLISILLGSPITFKVFLIPITIVPLTLFTTGFALFICSYSIFFPDIAQMYTVILSAWMYLTPIIYDIKMLPYKLQILITNLNPLSPILEAFRDLVYLGKVPETALIVKCFVIGILMFIIGWFVFTKRADKYVYVS